MDKSNINLLLIEDDKKEWELFSKIAKEKSNVTFIGMTDSEEEGLKLIKNNRIDGIILDLELNKGSGNGNGFLFMQNIKNLGLDKIPNVVVTTNVSSDSVYDFLHSNGVDLIFYKKQTNYSRENVIDTLILLSGYSKSSNSNTCLKVENNKLNEKEDKISELIDEELDLIGIGTHLQGRKYIHDAIDYVVKNEGNLNATVNQFLVKKYKKSSSTITRAIQNAILHAWRISSLEDLNKYYTAKINYETGVPTPTEFIYYYVDKIKKKI